MAITYTTPTVNTVTVSSLGSGYTTAGYNGATLTSTGSSTVSWAAPNTNFNDGNQSVMTIPHGSKTVEIDKAATLDVKGTVKINGVDLEERLSTIEQVLQIPTRDVTMEAKHPKLKALYEQYMHELEKYKTWSRLNGNENGTT